MSLNKRIKGDFTMESVDTTDIITIRPGSAGNVNIDGDLIVSGTQTTINTTDTDIVDNVIILNSGETLDGVAGGAGVSGLEIDRGIAANGPAGIQFNEASNGWEINNGDGLGFNPIVSGGGGMTAIVQDTDPHLGGDLDVNGWTITSGAHATIKDITIVTDPTGLLKIEQEISLKEQAIPTLPDGVAGYNKLSAGTIGAGGSGLYFVNDTDTDELVSKKKAIIYGIIF